jgi:hypothetical protein
LTTALSTQDVPSPSGAPDLLIRLPVGVADLLISLGEKEKALELLAFSLNQPDIEESTRERAERLYADLKARVSKDIVASAEKQGRLLRLDEIAAMLADLQRHIKY